MKKILSEYIQNAAELCPHCKSNDVTGKELDINYTEIFATAETQCNSCHGIWKDIWLLAAIQIPIKGEDDFFELMAEMPKRISEFVDTEWQKKMKTRIVKARNKKWEGRKE